MSFRITLEPSARTFAAAAGQTLLEAGLKAGIALPYSCRNGSCGTCRARIKLGSVDYEGGAPGLLSQGDAAAGFTLLCRARPCTDTTVEVLELQLPGGIRPRIVPARVAKIGRPAPDVAIVTLQLPQGQSFPFLAGQFVEVLLKAGGRRSYSIATKPSPNGVPGFDLHIRHSPGGLFTDYVFGSLKERDILRFEGPHGTFHLREDSRKPIVMVASGTGFGPIKAMCEEAFDNGLPRPIALYWGGRTRRDLYMCEVPASWTNSAFRFVPVLSDPTPGCAWSGRKGFVHCAAMQDFPDLSGHQVYACGSAAMVDAARADFIARCGLPANEFFADSFL